MLGDSILLPQRANNQKREVLNFRIGWDRGDWVPGAFQLDHKVPFKLISLWNFPNFFTFILGSPILLPQRANYGKRGILPTPKKNETEGFGCLGHSNWTICDPISHFCFQICSTLSLLYWEANNGKREFSQL